MSRIEIQNLVKCFGQTRAVDHVDLSIEQGDLFFLLGPSGCGKTTLLRSLAGFVQPDAGKIFFGNQEVTHIQAHKRGCSMVFQGYALWPHMTIFQNLSFGLEIQKIKSAQRKRLVAQALQAVQLGDQADKKPSALSGGQQQRVALARALVVKPKILLLDEPLSNLDALLRIEMRSEIRRVCKQAGMTAVYVTHDQKEALSMADQIALMHQGKVLQVGLPRELYEKPANRFAADFLGQTNFIQAKIRAVTGPLMLLDSPLGKLSSRAFPSKFSASVSAGQEVLCSVRYHAVLLSARGAPAAVGAEDSDQINLLPGRIVEKTYFGDTLQYRVRVRGCEQGFVSLALVGQHSKGFEIAEEVYVEIKPTQLVVLGQ